jgi:hypothetical protein
LFVPAAATQSGEVAAFLSQRYLYMPSPPEGALPVREAAIWVLHIVWSVETVFPVIRGRTVILYTEPSEQAPDVTVLLNQVVEERFPGWYEVPVSASGVKLTLSVDDAHA